MKPSRYNIWVDDPTSGRTLLYNSLYGSLVACDQKETDVVRRILTEPDRCQETDSETKAVLIEQKYLVEDSADELRIIEARKRSGIQDANRLDVIIMPTLDCNFACTYCYEVRRPSVMTDETEKGIRLWLAAEIPKFKVVMLLWFGGEPLICYERVISISAAAARIASESGVSIIAHITTNGYLLNPDRVNGLVRAGILDFQITVDGPPETHDKMRVLRNGKGTFKRVFDNVCSLARADDRVKVSLRVNFNHSNLHSIPRLLEMFPQDVRPHLRVVYEPIFGHCSLSATDNLASGEISEAVAKYYKMAEQLGYEVILGWTGVPTGKLVYCYAEREHQVILGPDGSVFKCSVSEFGPDDRVGFMSPDGSFTRDHEKWDTWINGDLFEEKCYSCAFLPLCMGGCRRMRLSHKGTGSYCSLVPTNASYILKQVALGSLGTVLQQEASK